MLFSISAQAEEKNLEDPTRIATKISFGHTDELVISGSLSLGPVKKLNARINEDASEWRLGGSWLFRLGIVNFSFSQSDFDNGGNKRNYSIGTFVPLSVLGISPAGWQLFPMAGFSYNDGEFPAQSPDPALDGEYVLTPRTTRGGYIGAFTLKALNPHWTLLAVLGASRGSDDYSGAWGGGGISYTIDKKQSANLFISVLDDDFGEKKRLGISYTHEF